MVAPAGHSAPGIVTTLQATTSNALEATGGYLASAQAVLTSKVPQETTKGSLDNGKISTTDTATAPATSAQSAQAAAHDPFQAASNTKDAVQPHVNAAKQTASSLINSATQTAATTSNAVSTQTQDTKAAVSGYATAATKAAQAHTSKPQDADSAQPLVDQAKGGPATPVGLPAEGIEGVLTYGEDNSGSAKQAEQ
jgi:hypothetical protein